MHARGFTLLEVLVATIVFAVGMLGLAAGMAMLTRHLAQARRAALVTATAVSRLDRLRVRACDTRTDDGERVEWGGAPLALLIWTWNDLGDSTYRVQLVATAAVPFARPLVRRETLTAVIPCRR